MRLTPLSSRPLRAFVLALVATAPGAMAGAQQAVGSFSARAVQTLADGSTQSGTIMKSGQNMRLEMNVGAQRSIQIMRGGEGVAFLVDPQQEIFARIEDPSVAQAVDGAENPCPDAASMQARQITCAHVGEGLISGITTQVWEIRGPQDAAATRVEWDTGRHRALAQTWPDGTTLTLTFQAMQDVNGRSAEYWSSALQIPGQAAALGGWWFDPELRVVVREQIPGGITREITDVTVGPVDDALFWPPAGYREVEPRKLAPEGAQTGAPQSGQ